jgi:hypothetical protein
MPAKLDLTGHRYGRLTVLRAAPRRGGRTAWWCRCACDREVAVITSNLPATARSRAGATRAISRPHGTGPTGNPGPGGMACGRRCSGAVPTGTAPTGPIMADEASRCADDGTTSGTSSMTWGRHARTSPSTALTRRATTPPRTAAGPPGVSRTATGETTSGLPGAASGSASPTGLRTSSCPAASSADASSGAGAPRTP